MSFATRHSNGSRIFDIDTTDWEYKSLAELFEDNGEDYVYPLYGFYINKKSEYGDAPVAYSDGYFVNLPQFMTDEVREMLKDEADIADIKANRVGFKIYSYDKTVGKKTKTCYSVNWIDMVGDQSELPFK